MLGKWDCGGVPCDEECSVFNQMLRDVIAVAYNAVCRDMPTEFCQQFTGYVTVGEPSNPSGDYIAAWIQDVSPYNPRNNQQTALQRIPRGLMAVGVKLLETGWPMIGETSPRALPSLETITGVAMESNAHAERVSRALWNAVVTRQMLENCGCCFMGMGSMRPVPASGGMVGWVWTVQLEVPW